MAFRNSKTRRHSEIKQTSPSTKQDFSGEALSKQNTEASLASLSWLVPGDDRVVRHICIRCILYLYLTLVSLNTIVFFPLRQVKFLILKIAKSTSVQCIRQVSGEELFLPQATQLTMWCQLCYPLTSHRITGSSEVLHCSANWTTKAILVPRLFDDRSWWCWTDRQL